MLEDIKQYFIKNHLLDSYPDKAHSIPKEYIVQNEEVRICGKGIVQLILDEYDKSRF